MDHKSVFIGALFFQIGQHICASSIEGALCVFCVFCVYVWPTWTDRRRKRLQTIMLEVKDREKERNRLHTWLEQ